MSDTSALLRRRTLWTAAVLALITLTGGGATVWLFRAIDDEHQQVAYVAAEELVEAEALGAAMHDRAANTRGYLLSGDPLFLEGRRGAQAEFDRQRDRLRARAGEGGDTEELARLDALVGRLDVASARALELGRTDRAGAVATWEADVRPLQDAIGRELNALVRAQRATFDAARDGATRTARRGQLVVGALAGLILVLLGAVVVLLFRAARRLIERARVQQERTMFQVLEQVPVGIFVTDATGKPYYSNRRSYELLGRGITASQRLDVIGEVYQAYEAGTDRPYPTARMPLVRALAGERSEVSDMEVRHGNDVVPLHVRGGPVHDADERLIYAVAAFQDVRELQRVALRDALTGLANRSALAQAFIRERLVAERTGRPLAIALLDLDHFKSVNDQHGHPVGDEVLRRTATILVESVRRTDVVARWGGEELAVLMTDTAATTARIPLEKALATLRQETFVGKDHASLHVSFSGGVVAVLPGESLEAAIARADALLYAAKRAGRARVFDEPQAPAAPAGPTAPT